MCTVQCIQALYTVYEVCGCVILYTVQVHTQLLQYIFIVQSNFSITPSLPGPVVVAVLERLF